MNDARTFFDSWYLKYLFFMEQWAVENKVTLVLCVVFRDVKKLKLILQQISS